MIKLFGLLQIVSIAMAEESHPPPVPPSSGVQFSGVFSSNMVLQRDVAAAVYGYCGKTGRGAQLFSSCNFTAGATVEISLASNADDATVAAAPFKTQTQIASDGTWKALLPSTAAGGSYRVSAACTQGCGNSTAAVLDDVTFGDIYFCR